MPGGTKKQFSLIRASLGTAGGQKAISYRYQFAETSEIELTRLPKGASQA